MRDTQPASSYTSLNVWIDSRSERILSERVLHIAARLLSPELHMRIRTMFFAAAMMIWSSASGVIAQNTSSSAAYLALISTPAGGVPPMAKSWMLADPAIVPGVQAEAIWGHLSGTHEGLDTFTAVASTPFASGAAAVELSFGLLLASCDSLVCGGYLMASSGVDGRVFHAHAGDATVTLGLGGHVGLATPSDAERWSLWANAPLSIAMGPEGGDAIRAVCLAGPWVGARRSRSLVPVRSQVPPWRWSGSFERALRQRSHALGSENFHRRRQIRVRCRSDMVENVAHRATSSSIGHVRDSAFLFHSERRRRIHAARTSRGEIARGHGDEPGEHRAPQRR